MKIDKFLMLALSAALVFMPSCKKEKKEDVKYKNSFKGSISFALPDFVAPGDVYELEPTGLTRPEEGKGIGYYWACPELGIKKDTTRVEDDPLEKKGKLTLSIKDTLGKLTLKCVAFADGYYTSSTSKEFVVLHPEKSLVVENPVIDAKTMEDVRDGKKYSYRKVGDLDWMIENLAYAEAGVSYYECKAADPIVGRFYTWNEAKKVCPEGWRLPSKADWDNLIASMGADSKSPMEGISGSMMTRASVNKENLWEFWPEVKITNQSGFSALPAGYVQYSGKVAQFAGAFQYAAFWSTEERDEEQATYYYLFMKNPDLLVNFGHKSSFAASVRCVR